MAVPTYTSDLTTINDCSSTSTPDTWAEPTGMTAGTTIAAQTDFYIEGASCISKLTNQTGTSGAGFVDASGATTLPSGEAFWFWIYHIGAKALDTRANGGLQVIIGNTLANYYAYYLEGSDTYIVGGWKRVPIDPTLTGNDADGFAFRNRTQGTPSGSWIAYGGGAVQLSAVAGASLGIDHVAYGRDLLVEFGSTADGYATFSSIATNDAANARGQFQLVNGAYYQQGLLILGSATNAVDFRDTAGSAVFIQKTPKVASGFNEIEIRNASSRVDWGAVSFTSLGLQSRGKLTITDNADVNIDGCSFTGMDTFSLQAGTDVLNSTFRGCNAITAPGSNLSGTKVLVPTVAADASALVWTDTTETDGKLDNMAFSKGTTAHHAISFASTTTDVDYTLRGIAFSGFNATPASNDSAIYVAATTGTITIYLISCSGNITAKSAGAAVTFISDPITVTVTTKDVNGAAVGSANVFLAAASGGSGILPVSATVNTITRVNATTAEVTHAAVHNMLTGDKVYIQGANQAAYNGVFTITLVGVATPTTMYRYTLASDPGTNATGTLTATFVFLKDTTHVSTGVLTMSRVISADQNVIGWARKSTSNPRYKEGIITGTVTSSGDTAFNPVLTSDE